MSAARTVALRSTRWMLGAATLVAGLWILVNAAAYRRGEAWLASRLVGAVVDRQAHLVPDTSTFFVGLGTDHGVGLRIDQLCSTGAVVGLTAVITGGLLLLAGLDVRRAVAGVAAMAGLLSVVNAVRLTVLSWSVTRWGLTGWFEWLHLYGGAAISMVAITVGCGLYLQLVRRGPSLTQG